MLLELQNMLKELWNINNFSSNRLDWVDATKGIGILLVVIAHVNYSQPLLTIIYSFHMPLFFVVSGLLFKPESYGNFLAFLKKKTQTLLCPYVLFYLLSIIYHISVQFVADYESMDWEVYLKYFVQMFLSQGSANVANAPLWFVPCLMLVETIYYYISKTGKYGTIVISILITAFGWFIESDFLKFDNTLLPWSLDSAMFAIGFFAFGQLLSDSIFRMVNYTNKGIDNRIKYLLFMIVCAVVLVPVALVNGKVSMGSKELNNGLLFYITGIIGFLFALFSGALFRKSKFLKYCGKNSFYIMSTHYLARETLRVFIKFIDIPMYDKTRLIETIIPIIVVLISSLSFVFIYNIIKYSIIKKRSESLQMKKC